MVAWKQAHSGNPGIPYADTEIESREKTCEQGVGENWVGPQPNPSQGGSIG